MKRLLVIGIGAGNPDYITLQAVKALNRVDVFFLMDKGPHKDKLIDLRRDISRPGHALPADVEHVRAGCRDQFAQLAYAPFLQLLCLVSQHFQLRIKIAGFAHDQVSVE